MWPWPLTTHDLDHGFSWSNFEIAVSQNGRAGWYCTKGVAVGHSWPWPWRFGDMTIWWPRSGVWIYQIVTGVTSVVGVPSTHIVMKWTTRFIRFTGWIPLKYGSTTTPPIIAHCQKTPMSSLIFHIAIPKTSNIRRTPSFDLLTDEFSKRVSIIRRALY